MDTINTVMTVEQELEQLRAENAALKAEAAKREKLGGRNIRFKVAEKGGVSVYGLNAIRPVTLYANQWEALNVVWSDLMKFIIDHQSELSYKEKATTATVTSL